MCQSHTRRSLGKVSLTSQHNIDRARAKDNALNYGSCLLRARSNSTLDMSPNSGTRRFAQANGARQCWLKFCLPTPGRSTQRRVRGGDQVATSDRQSLARTKTEARTLLAQECPAAPSVSSFRSANLSAGTITSHGRPFCPPRASAILVSTERTGESRHSQSGRQLYNMSSVLCLSNILTIN